MDHLAALKVFVRVAESGSFSRAAEDLGLPRASVSTAVQAVEARAGTRLLNRTTRRVALTADGLAFLERAHRLLDEAEELDGLFRQGDDRVKGGLKVSLPERLATHVLIPALPAFLARYRGLRLELSVTDRFVDLIAGGVDCVIRGGELPDSALVGRRLGTLVQGTFASPAYLAALGTPRVPDDLAGHRLIGYVSPSAAGTDFSWEGRQGETVRTLALSGSVAVDNAEAQVACALAGLGLIQVPVHGMRSLVAVGRMVEVLAAFRPPPLPMTVLYPHRRHRSPKVVAFIAWVETVLAAAEVWGDQTACA